MIYNYYYNVNLLSDSMALLLKNKIAKSLRKIKEIKDFIIDESLLVKINATINYFEEKLKHELKEFLVLSFEQMKSALFLTQRGILCFKVYQKLFSIGSKTSLVAVMLGLLAPKEHRYIEKSAIDEAENMTRVFVEDVNFLFSVITDHQISKRTLNKYNGKLLWFLKENFSKERFREKILSFKNLF